jgi:hypothetical protein
MGFMSSGGLRQFPVLLFAMTLLLAACGSDGQSTTGEAIDTTAEPTTTTIDIRSRQVPDHPDVAYVMAVQKSLDHVIGDVRRDVYGTQSMSQMTYDRLDDVYDEHQGEIAKKIWSKASMEPLDDVVMPPGDGKMSNFEILDSRPGCVVFAADTDNSSILKEPTRPMPRFVLEIRTYPGDHRSNLTPWKYDFEATYDPAKRVGYTCDE